MDEMLHIMYFIHLVDLYLCAFLWTSAIAHCIWLLELRVDKLLNYLYISIKLIIY